MAVATPYEMQDFQSAVGPKPVPARKTKAQRSALKTTGPKKRSAYPAQRVDIPPPTNEDAVRPSAAVGSPRRKVLATREEQVSRRNSAVGPRTQVRNFNKSEASRNSYAKRSASHH